MEPSNIEGYATCLSVDLLPGGKYFYSKDESKIKIIKITNSTQKQQNYKVFTIILKNTYTHIRLTNVDLSGKINTVLLDVMSVKKSYNPVLLQYEPFEER